MSRLKKQGTPKERTEVGKAKLERLFHLDSFEKTMSDTPLDVFLGMTNDLLQFIDRDPDSQSKFFGVGYYPTNNPRLQQETDLKQRFLMKIAQAGFLTLDNFHVTEVNDDLDPSQLIPALLVHVEFDKESIGDVLKKIKREILKRLRRNGEGGSSESTAEIPRSKNTRHIYASLGEKNEKGYFKFTGRGEEIYIGGIETKKYRLLKSLMDPHTGIEKTINVVFDAIKNQKDGLDTTLTGLHSSDSRKLDLIQYQIKEFQKIEGLRGRISLGVKDGRTIWLRLK